MMITQRPVHIETAGQLIDFKGKSDAAMSFADIQLKGAVAIYNMLMKQDIAYLADEVGMGKTYVALGAVALMKHFNPGMRVLYITPRRNIQMKWIKEIRNFTANNWKVIDYRVKTFHDAPVDLPVVCERLSDYVKELAINPNRDFILRMSSFSLPNSTRNNKSHINSFIDIMPWINIPDSRLDKCSYGQLKDIYGIALNRIIPDYDLVVIDEGHNFKHGFGDDVSSRNRVFGLTFGRHPGEGYEWMGWEPVRRIGKALILSATPLEYDYRYLWNQLDLVGLGKPYVKLYDKEQDDEKKKNVAAEFIIRRLTHFNINDKKYTKNMYRREWRGGGLEIHDEPFELKNDARQRLVVALMQKKVSEIMEARGRDGGRKFSRSFQIGMLSSFESFFQTASVKDSDTMVFDQSELVDDDDEKKGIDTLAVNQIADSYRRRFGHSMPHPKMDLVAEEAFGAMKSGEKTLIFVRRIGSVKELSQKISEKYDAWINEYIRSRLSPGIQASFDERYNGYLSEKKSRRGAVRDSNVYESEPDDETAELIKDRDYNDEKDEGGLDSFFSWFFRGKPHKEFNTGVSFRKNRLDSRNSPYSLMFEDNYILYLLGKIEKPLAVIAGLSGITEKECGEKLKEYSYTIYSDYSKSTEHPRYYVYHSYQQAALYLIATGKSAESVTASIILNTCYSRVDLSNVELKNPHANYPGPAEFLNINTFFTELNNSRELAGELWLGRITAEENRDDHVSFAEYFREREERRILITTSIKLGHPLVDLWILAVNEIGSMDKTRTTETSEIVQKIIQMFLKLLVEQRSVNALTSYREISLIADNYKLLRDINFHDIGERKVFELKNYLADTLGSQYPISGMHGGVNSRIIKQFRMPGYPYVLVTTDVLQEGEDLHTFCSRIVHYGITYTPSAMEQRTGRIDRIGSLTGRRMNKVENMHDEHKLQVYYPYLKDTYEIVQAHEVFRRMNKFIELMHTSLSSAASFSTSTSVSAEKLKTTRPVQPVSGLLISPFDVKTEYTHCGEVSDKLAFADTGEVINTFNELVDKIGEYYFVQWDDTFNQYSQSRLQRLGTFLLNGTGLVKKDAPEFIGRIQPVSLHLKTGNGGKLIFKIVSPMGVIREDDEENIKKLLRIQKKHQEAKLCAISDGNFGAYNFTVEADMLFGVETTSIEEILHLIRKTVITADIVEREILGTDKKLSEFSADLRREVINE